MVTYARFAALRFHYSVKITAKLTTFVRLETITTGPTIGETCFACVPTAMFNLITLRSSSTPRF